MLRRAALAALLIASLASVAGAAGHGLPPRHEYPRVVLSVLNKYPRCFPGYRPMTVVDPGGRAATMGTVPGAWTLDTLAYLESTVQFPYGVRITRIGGTTGAAFAGPSATGTQLTRASGTWGMDNRHHYTKDSPWNADETLYIIQNPGSTNDSTNSSGKTNPGQSGSTMAVLDATANYAVTNYFQCGYLGKVRDSRWHPTNPFWMIVLLETDNAASPAANDTAWVTKAASVDADSLAIVDVRDCSIVAGIKTGIRANLIGAGEGGPVVTADGKILLALNTIHADVPYRHYVGAPPTTDTMPDTGRVFRLDTRPLQRGAAFSIPADSLDIETVPDGIPDREIGHCQLSARGNYFIAHYGATGTGGSGASTGGADQYRVFPVDTATLAIGPLPKVFSSASQLCATNQIGSLQTWRLTAATWWSYGWARGGNHPDQAFNPFTGHEVVQQGRRCGGSNGRVELFDLVDGSVTYLSPSQATEPSVHHNSSRNSIGRLGYAFMSYQDNANKDRQSELVMYKMDGSGVGIRLGQDHTRYEHGYRSEAHPVMSPTGRFMAFSSDWTYGCVKCGQLSDGTAKIYAVKDYILDLRNLCLP